MDAVWEEERRGETENRKRRGRGDKTRGWFDSLWDQLRAGGRCGKPQSKPMKSTYVDREKFENGTHSKTIQICMLVLEAL